MVAKNQLKEQSLPGLTIKVHTIASIPGRLKIRIFNRRGFEAKYTPEQMLFINFGQVRHSCVCLIIGRCWVTGDRKEIKYFLVVDKLDDMLA